MNLKNSRSILVGAGLGLAWGAGWRGWMAAFAGSASTFSWSGTFAGVLLPSTLVGAALGWAEQARQSGAPVRYRWTALTPLLFVAFPAMTQADFVARLQTGLGTGAIGTALIGMLGGYAVAGRGPRGFVRAARLMMAALIIAAIIGSLFGSPDPSQAATTPRGAYLVLAFGAFSALLAWACAIPHRERHPEQVS
jgi:hypothetical protein